MRPLIDCLLLACVQISWNGATAETQERIMKNSKLATQLSNLRTFIGVRDEVAAAGGNRCNVTLQVTFMEQNLNEMPAIVKLAIDHQCDRVKGHHLWSAMSSHATKPP